ncbi:hypothetical protein FPV67DRAFT_1496838 [Lyophyllum atratum]|nr:hypothetical protein FPV67DRAFT_1496838 [Lyophyllum atratum]
MIDTKSPEITQAQSAPPPPTYPGAEQPQPSRHQAPEPQSQWQHATQPAHSPPPPIQTMSAADIGGQYRNAQFALCAQGNHSRTTKYGVCGIITGVLLFPIGLICLFMDTEEVCSRCGNRL